MQRSSMAEPDNTTKDIHQGEETKTCRNKNKKSKIMANNGKIHYGYKLHTIIDTKHNLIRRIHTTTANVPDSQVDLSK